MNGALPLLRIFTPTVRKSCSRIPHITAHILQRRRAHAPTTPERPPTSNGESEKPEHSAAVRHASTVMLSGRGGNHKDDEIASEEQAAWWAIHANSRNGTETSQPGDPPHLLMQAFVNEGHPERVLHALLHPRIGASFIREASDHDFSTAFELLDPYHFLDERKKIDRAIHPKLYLRFKIRRAASLGHKFDWYLKCLENIMFQRRQSGHPPTLEVYRHLLRWTEVIGTESLARDLFDSAMPQDGIIPDLACYNSYLGACVWNGAFDVDFRYKRRNAGQNLLLRERVITPKNVPGILQLRRPRYEDPAGETMRGHALTIFGELTNRGHKPDEATFVNLMLAMGYNSDISGIKSVLKSVWNIDVDMLGRFDEEEIESPTFYEDGDPLRPSPQLLHAVVYVFGTNNDPFHASFLLDYISRNYNLQIPHAIWMLVYELTYVLAQSFNPGRQRRGHAIGKLPEDALARFSETIADEPHNVKPNTWMLAKLANNARKARGSFEASLDAFASALLLRDEQMTMVSKLYDEMLGACNEEIRRSESIPPTSFLDKRRVYIHETLKLDRDLELLCTEVREILSDSWQFNITPWHHDQWSVRTVPNLIQEFATFLPPEVTIKGPTFVYTIEDLKWHKERAITDSNGQFDVKTARLRNILEEENTQLLMYKAHHAQKFIDMTERTCFVCKTRGEHKSEDCPRWEVGLAGYGLRYGVEELSFSDVSTSSATGIDTTSDEDEQMQAEFWRQPLPSEE